MRAIVADDESLRRNLRVLRALAGHHGLSDLALGADPGELIATVARHRSYLDVAAFELEIAEATGLDVRVTPSGAPGAQIRELLSDVSAA